MRFFPIWCLFFVFNVSIFAISVQFPNDTLDISTKQSSTLTVTNPSDEIKAAEIFVMERSYTVEGEEVHVETEDFFLIPSQFIIQPRQEQVVTLQWVGDNELTYEQPYRVIVQEVPLKDKDTNYQTTTNAAVQIRLRFVNSVYVLDRAYQSEIALLDVMVTEEDVQCLFENNGNKHKIVNGFDLEISQFGESHTYSITLDDLGINYNFLPREKRRITFKNSKLPLEYDSIKLTRLH